MCRTIAALASLTAILTLVAAVPAEAGGASSAPSKYNNAAQNRPQAQNSAYTITEFSSSSAKSAPKR